MKAPFRYVFFLAIIIAGGCTRSGVENVGNTSVAEQTFTIAVESIGELFSSPVQFSGVISERNTEDIISSVSPSQTFDKLALIIMKKDSSAEVVYKKIIDNWSSTDNLSSKPWSTEEGQGRYADVILQGDECLEDGMEYIVYAVGYQSGTYGGYEPFKGIDPGDFCRKTEVATVPDGMDAAEIFAGAEIFRVEDGEIQSSISGSGGLRKAIVVLRRQVAGTFGYFTSIPVTVAGVDVAKVRLVATKRNKSVVFGGFASMENPESFNKENVVNGINPRTDYDACLSGSYEKNAFIVYEIDLCRWFPGPDEDSGLPLDVNGDGLLNAEDSNWEVDQVRYPKGTISLPAGSVFGDNFWIPVAMTSENIATGNPTFQMQLTDIDGNVLRFWNVMLRNVGEEKESRTIVSLPEDGNGRARVELADNEDTEMCFSIARNRLYSMGEKSFSQTYGDDEPIDLSEADNLVLDVNHEWEIGNLVIFK